MQRRDFCKSSMMAAGLALGGPTLSAPSAAEEFPKAPGLTHYLAEFIVNTRYEDIPDDVMALGKKSILDGFGLALAGSVSTLAPPMKEYIQSLGPCAGKSSMIGTAQKLSPRFAAFANGNFIHADDYDDTQLAVAKDRVYGLLTHPTVPVLPPAFALCEAGGRSGKDLLTAYHVGVEVECKIAEAISPRHYNDGFHTTGTVGSFGSAAACAKLRGLDVTKTAYALGVAAAEAGGLRENFGSMTKPFHAGHAAEAGVVAADLAALGWTAAPEYPRSAVRILPRRRRRLRSRGDRRSPGQALDLRLTGRFHQTAPLGIANPSGDGRNDAPHPPVRHQARGGGKS